VRFTFIHTEKANHRIGPMCRLLEVTRQGYYAWRNRAPSTRVADDEALSAVIREVFDESRQSYGSPRVLAALRTRGLRVSKRRVERAMRGMGLTPPTCGRHCKTTIQNPMDAPAPNTLDRDFTASRPNERWVTDITYVWTAAGWSYIAAILDLFSRRVVGWAISSSLETSLVDRALSMALLNRRPHEALLYHSDRGCQYTSHDHRKRLADLGISVSMSRKGNCWDNAVSESFFATMKRELIHRRAWLSREDLRRAVFEYIEVFYNRRRIHSFLNYKTPTQFEQEYVATAA
jgi:transposase InsO family protein